MNPEPHGGTENHAGVSLGGKGAVVPDVAPQLAVHAAADGRSLSLVLLTVLAVVFVLHWARAFFIPLMFGVMISYAISPLVNLMQQWRIPRAIGAAVLLIGIVGGVSSLAYSLSDEAAATIETLPEAAQKFRQTLRKERGTSESAIEKVQKATTELERAASDTPMLFPAPPRGVTRVQIEKPKFDIQEHLWAGTMGAVGFAGQVIIVLFLAYFLMVSGDSFRRKLVRISGPTFSKKKITLQVLDEITGQIQRYLLVQLFTSSLVGVVTWLAFLWIGVEHAAIWGIAAAILNTIPYLGAVIFTIGTALVAFLQFGTIGMALSVSGIALVITSVEGFWLTPWLTSRASHMNAVVIFAGVLFWGWLWGVWGLLLGIPILMTIKAVCDHVEDLKPVGELLGK
ncbi:MAG: transport protein [Gammaproteobacteria bacterium]|nr:MAG: transport protein [Gammaproteobacteria bacterium]TND01409.1 MAG: transport protein [Gammaproteobacteria bacterium]